jgi:hypothetical protein
MLLAARRQTQELRTGTLPRRRLAPGWEMGRNALSDYGVMRVAMYFSIH